VPKASSRNMDTMMLRRMQPFVFITTSWCSWGDRRKQPAALKGTEPLALEAGRAGSGLEAGASFRMSRQIGTFN
jgi:hypothetical protein